MENTYENENLAIRYVTLTSSSDTKIKIGAYKKLIDICKQLNWAV